MNAKIVVMGSNSFSGAAFCAHAMKKGAEVIGISRSAEPDAVFLPYRWQSEGRHFRFHQLDLNHDLDRIMTLIEEVRPQYVVNFAAQSMVAQSWAAPEQWFMTNIVSTVRWHDRLRRCEFLEKYAHISTPEVYGSCSGEVTESAAFNPSTPYAVSRAACDMSLRTFQAVYGFPVIFTRAANVYGPGQQLYRIIPRTVLFIKLGRKLHLDGGGHSVRSFIHIRDVAEATLSALERAPAGETYHLSTRRIMSIRELIELICRMMGVDFADQVEVSEERLGKDASYRLNSDKARRELAWQDQISLEEGIEEVIHWVENNFQTLRNGPLDYIHKP